ncbi:MAG: YihY family inner membrane protein [Planctomycetota bacterium]
MSIGDGHPIRYGADLMVHCWRRSARHRAEGMAAELTYRTIFALIPVVVLGLVLFRVFGGLDDVQLRVENQLFSFFGVPEIPTEYLQARAGNDQFDSEILGESNVLYTTEDERIDRAAADAIDGGDGALVAEATTLQTQASIRRVLHDVTSKIASIDFASIGVFGLILFVYAAVALANATESLFNVIYDAPTQRPIHMRIAIHWSIITLGSGLLALSLYMSGQVVDWVGTIGAGSWPLWLVRHALSLLAGWVLMFLLYALMPNTNVSVRAAAAGAGVAAVLWELAKFGFQFYVSTAVPYSAVYGSLGLIPLFLFWMYLTWLIVLFGLELTSTLQAMHGGANLGGRLIDDSQHLSGDPDWMLPIMSEVAGAFSVGKSIDRQFLADRLGLPSHQIRLLETRLVEEGFLRHVSGSANESPSLTLARPADGILIADVLAVAHQMRPTSAHGAWQSLNCLKQAEREAAGDRTLADLLATGAG